MAKGNMLQGMARGKVGDVVFSRLNGEQIARVRNRNPKNPKTNAQLYQRAIMATVMQAYSAGKVIFDHSFEGITVGEGNQRRFMSLNAKRLRSILAADLAAYADERVDQMKLGSYNAPGTVVPAFPLIQCSEGHYDNTAFDVNNGLPEPTKDEKVKEYVARVGLVPGDIYTIVGFLHVDNNQIVFELPGATTPAQKQYNAKFFYVRLKVKEGLDSQETAITTSSPISVLFDLDGTYNCAANMTATICQTELDYVGQTIISTDGSPVVGAVIRSRMDEDLRSTTTFKVMNHDFVNSYDDFPGIGATYLLQAWKQGTQKVGDSDLILEGGDN